MERYEALRILDDPETAPEALGRVVDEYPDLRPRVARHPAAPPDLLAWLAALRHPAIDVGLASRVPPFSATPPLSAAPPRRDDPVPDGGALPPPQGSASAAHGPVPPEHGAVPAYGSAPVHGSVPSPGPAPASPGGMPPVPGARQGTGRRTGAAVAGVVGALVIVLGLIGIVLGLRIDGSTVEAREGAASVDRDPGADAGAGLTDSAEAGPRTATAPRDGIPFGADGAAGSMNPGAVDVAVYVDYQCPHCASFDEINRDYLERARLAGDVTLVLHPVSILDRTSDSRASTRAASAVAFVAEHDPSAALELHELLLSEQPSPGLGGLTDAEIAALAERAGASSSTVTAIRVGTATELFGDWVAITTDAAVAAAADGFGTPRVHLDGELFSGDWSDPAALPAGVRAAVPSAA